MAEAAQTRPPTDEDLLLAARNELAKIRERRQEGVDDGDGVQASLDSFNFGAMQLRGLPEELMDIIKDEAVRLALDRNRLTSLSGLSLRFSEFSRLKYLVVRHNHLTEFPPCVCATY